ncbi:hypothetical protein ACHAWF_017557 [Thalassiosira exigua]
MENMPSSASASPSSEQLQPCAVPHHDHVGSATMASDRSSAVDSPAPLTHSQIAKAHGLRYAVNDVPPLGTSVLLGIQHYLTMLGATFLIPTLVCPPMGADAAQTGRVISTIFLVSGFNTLLQTSIGDRLPIVQGGSFSYLPTVFGIIANPELQAIPDDSDRFHATMRTVQGALIVVGCIQVFVGYTGLFSWCLRFVSPMTVACVITAIGLGLYGIAFNGVSECWAVGLTMMGLGVLFCLYLPKAKACGLFDLFPILMAIVVTWAVAGICTAAGAWAPDSACSTSAKMDVVHITPWFWFPYPFQWGMPIFRAYAIVPMIGSMLAAMIESIGDYYSCANISGAPPPTSGIISRGLAAEGIGVLLSGLWGTGAGTTSYSENIGAIGITHVGSRAVVQCGALTMIFASIIGKFGALLASMPHPMASGLYCVVFGVIVAVGLSNLKVVDLSNQRNLFIVGFTIFNSMSIAGPGGYFSTVGGNPFGDTNRAAIALSIFSSPMIIAFIISMVLDNTSGGATTEERGLTVWAKASEADVNNDDEYVKVYSLPLCLARVFKNCTYLEYTSRGKMPPPPVNGYQHGSGDLGDLCCPCIFQSDDDSEASEEECV